MSADDPQRGRRPNPNPRNFKEKGNYSPSVSYNYGQNAGNFQPPSQQNPSQRRRPDRYKPRSGTGGGNGAGINNTDKLIKQNDIIIRLLKEIKDRLPEGVESTPRRPSRSKQPERGRHKRNEEYSNSAVDEDGEENGHNGGNREEGED